MRVEFMITSGHNEGARGHVARRSCHLIPPRKEWHPILSDEALSPADAASKQLIAASPLKILDFVSPARDEKVQLCTTSFSSGHGPMHCTPET